MSGHAAGDGMDRVLDLDAFFLELVGEFAYAVLRLRDRHAVSRNDDDLMRVREHDRHVVGRGRANVLRSAAAPRRRLHAAAPHRTRRTARW